MNYGEPGVFVCFEETSEELAQNVASMGRNLDDLIAKKLVVIEHIQIDRSEIALHLCARNIERNQAKTAQALCSDWDTFQSDTQFDLILGSDVLYATPMHARLQVICDDYLAPEGKVLFSDPLRSQGLRMLEAMATSGWRVSVSKWSIAVLTGARTIAVYEARRQ